MAALNLESRKKLKKMIPMLASDQPGDVVAAATAINKTLKASGADFIDLASTLTKAPNKETVVDYGLSDDVITLRNQLINAAKMLATANYQNVKLQTENAKLKIAVEKQKELAGRNSNAPSRFFYFIWFLIGLWIGGHH